MINDCGEELPGSNDQDVGGTTTTCSDEEKDDKCILIYCEHTGSEGKRYYRSYHQCLDVVQTDSKDIITIWTNEPDAPNSLTITRDGVEIESLSATGRAGGKEYSLNAKYCPQTAPYDSAKAFFQSIITYLLPPTRYVLTGLSKTLYINSYNPDQWAFSISLPPFEKMSMGRVLNNSESTEVIVSDGINLEQTRIKGSISTEISVSNWKTSTTVNIDESYSNYCAKLTTSDLYADVQASSYGFKAKSEEESVDVDKSVFKSIKITKNNQEITPDSLDFILTILSLATNLIKLIKEFKENAPQIGWYIDFSLTILEGTFKVAWGWKEYIDNRAYYYVGAGIKLNLFETVFEIGLGVDIPAFKAQICGQYNGLIEMDLGQFETTSPDIEDSEITLGSVTGTIQGGFYGRIEIGYSLDIEGGIETGIETKMEAVYNFNTGFKFSGQNKWTGITVKLEWTTEFCGIGTTHNEEKTLIEEITLTEFELPSSQKSENNDLSKYEISNKAVDALEKGWDIKVKQTNYHMVDGLFGKKVESKRETIDMKELADIIADFIFLQKDVISLDKKTVEGICHSVRKKMDELGKRFGSDWVEYNDLINYLTGTEFQTVIKDARDPVKTFINS